MTSLHKHTPDEGWSKGIPENWGLHPMRSLFTTKKEIADNVNQKHTLLRLAKEGVMPRTEDSSGKNPENYDTYQVFNSGDLCMCLFDYDVTPRTVGIVKERGMLTGAYTRLIPKKNVNSKYYYYLFLYLDLTKELLHLCTGLRSSLSKSVFWPLRVPVPDLQTQNKIVSYIDSKTDIIDQIIEKKQKLIELLQEKRSALITQAVTKGLDPKTKMKPSGIDWLREVPKKWEKRPLKYLFEYQSGGVWGEEALGDENDLICVRVADYDFIEFVAHSTNFTTRNVPQIKKELILDEYSVLLEKSGGGDQQPVGRAVRYLEKDRATCSNFIQKLQIYRKYNPEYIVYLLTALYLEGVTKKVIKKTTGIQNLDLAAFLRTDVCLPGVEDQINIVNYIKNKSSGIVNLSKKINKQIEYLTEYRSSLIYHAVTGKIKV